MKRILQRVAIYFLAILAGLALFACAFGNKLVFVPTVDTREQWERSKTLPTATEEIGLQSKDGTKLCAWASKAPDARAAILFLHGNGGNLRSSFGHIEALQKIPALVLAIDYRGYGISEGSPDEEGLYQDAQAAYAWLRAQGFESKDIFVYGQSLGGAVAIELARREPVAGIVLEATFTSIGDMAKRVVPLVPLGWAIGPKFKSADKVAELRVPKLHFHGRNDEVVPFALGRKLFDAAAEPKRWMEYAQMRHNEWPGNREKDWLEAIQAFIEESRK